MSARPNVRVDEVPPVPPSLYAGLRWRNIGPFRAGRVAAVSGAIGQPGVFYAGLPAGGVWKTTSAGETWYPVFDDVKDVASIGAIEVAPSDPNVIYAGTGDMITGGGINEGNGVYRSADAGRTWTHVGLDATRQIPSLLVDPRDPNVVLVAAQGDVHAKSGERGVFRTTDGGRTWTRTLFADDSTTGVQKLARAFDVPNVIFATTVRHYTPFVPAPAAQPPRTPPGANSGPSGTALYKSTDGGATWTEISGGGLPRLAGRTSVAVAMRTNARRVFLVTNAGLWRSDDGGAAWRQMAADDERIRNGQGGYNCGVYVDPQNPDVVYTINTSSYRSTDGGATFTGFKGAPGGDDPQQMWIDPTNGQRIFLGLDQGAVVSLDGGATWSSWYNQSTEQIYHLAIDGSSPYWIYGTQQDAGAIRTRARGTLGAVTPLDWNPVPGWEWGTVVPDPLNANVVYASGNGIVKITYPGEQWINVSPAADPAARLRTTSSQPLVWAPWNRHELLAGFQRVMSTVDGGAHWTALSGDLTVPNGADTAVTGNRGAIETIAASTVMPNVVWVGSNNGLIHVTRDHGRTWSDVTIPNLPNPRRAFVSMIDASHTDAGTAYVAVDYHTTGDYAPYVFRTHDWGRTWTRIVEGLPTGQPSGSFARVVRADPKKAGLLFLGTESGMFVSFDDGDHWQSLQLNLPNTSFRDLAIRDDDLVAATYGRGLWVLDAYSVLRQLAPSVAREPAHLFRPADAVRLRRNPNADTPFPPEVPHALNPPDGAIVYYSLASAPSGPVTLDVLDAAGRPVRHLSSVAAPPVAEAARPPEPGFWLAPPSALPTQVGTNRASWDLRSDAPPAFVHTFEINANPGQTPPSPEGPLALPGTYTVRLTVDGRAYTQPLVVRPDPHSPATAAALALQHALLTKLTAGMQAAWDGAQQVNALRAALTAAVGSTPPADVAPAVAALRAVLDSLGGVKGGTGFRPFGAAAPAPTFVAVNGTLVDQLQLQDYGDMAPTTAALRAYGAACGDLRALVARWARVVSTDLPALNAALAKHGTAPLTTPKPAPSAPTC